ncbi:class III extradiol dioxygenase subunit B-like domain-containing protein [Streptacidiphilus fuscans]|uniref:Class III extradiol dioxygenase subunit B-like domain-containing protein n=1 Tax=Streptacidiphilus fuscans TaxID=2789292 RepID=A0A931B9U4_9ACTN|nr:class III extradiol dioxygenase subunit B-like domain-containing protein [Streptacidiphilus fuscans]MBF9073784.1 class III extradiol dioxygenase subunit B-like domain-containing protein [Streptacidiphilus fuscans]
MLVAAAVCPCPPLLVPEVAVGAAPELDGLRAACDEALAVLLAAKPERIWVVGPGAEHRMFDRGGVGGFRSFGVDVTMDLGEGDASETLPASLAVGAWLLERAGWDGPAFGLAVPDYLEQALCRENGLELARSAERVGVLILGEGSARRTLKAPGYLDERAKPFDAAVAAGLAEGEVPPLDSELAFDLMASGRAPWQVLSGAAEGSAISAARLLFDDAPYGVGYFVASWV